MRASRAAGWIAGAVVLVLGILAGTWFFLAAPKFEDAAATMDEAENTAALNDVLAMQVAKLRADFENLETYKAELATLELGIPREAQLTAHSRLIQSLADANGVVVTELSPGIGAPVEVVAPAPPPAPAPAEESGDAPAEEGADAEVAETPAAPAEPTSDGVAQIEGFLSVPVSVKVIGPYANVSAFLTQLQATERLYSVSGLQGARQEQSDASGGKPATAAGDIELLVHGFIYVLRDPAAVVLPAEEPAEPAPMPGSPNNPFAPIG